MALMKSLYMQQYDAEVAFEPQNNRTSGLEPYLPKSTQSHLIIPFMVGIQPLFSIIITSSEQYWTFRTPDINFVRSMGVILRAQVLQSRVVEADMAKTTFLSSISHELRTPLHGLMSGLQLFEDAIDNEDVSGAAEFLPIIKNSGYALQNILNDMLEFGQLAHGKTGSTTKEVDLGKMLVSAVKTCIPRYYTWHKGTSNNVIITVEYEDRDWTARIDESGFQRCVRCCPYCLKDADDHLSKNSLQRHHERHESHTIWQHHRLPAKFHDAERHLPQNHRHRTRYRPKVRFKAVPAILKSQLVQARRRSWVIHHESAGGTHVRQHLIILYSWGSRSYLRSQHPTCSGHVAGRAGP
jgi:hypothetical protein